LSKVSEIKNSDFASRYREIKKVDLALRRKGCAKVQTSVCDLRAVKKYKTMKTKIGSSPGHLKKIRALYIRYADDWVIFTNMDEETVLAIKKEIAGYLKVGLAAQPPREGGCSP
jgi:hypothetical protein